MSFLRFYRQYKAKRHIRSYLAGSVSPKLQLGAGKNALSGWLNSDAHPTGSVIFVDTRKPLPFPDASFDFIFSEHHLEQHTFPEAVKMLQECKRVLKPNGVLRIHTPDLEVLINLHTSQKSPLQEQYIRFIMDTFCSDLQRYEDELVLNNTFYNFGHRFLWSETLLTQILQEMGFAKVQKQAPQESDHVALKNIAGHGGVIQEVAPSFDGAALNAFEVMALEAVRS